MGVNGNGAATLSALEMDARGLMQGSWARGLGPTLGLVLWICKSFVSDMWLLPLLGVAPIQFCAVDGLLCFEQFLWA